MNVRALGLVTAIALGASGCAASPARQTTVLSLTNLDCAECGEDLARALIHEDGVHKTAFDRRRVELTIVADPRISARDLAEKKRPAGEDFGIVVGPGRGGYIPPSKPTAGSDVVEIAKNGADVPDLTPYLAPGKVTIVDFSASWCAPCRKLDEHVLGLLTTRRDLAYRKLDVGDWDTPLALRYLRGVKELPYVMIFDARGHRVDTQSGLDLDRLDRAIDRAAEAGR